MRAEGSAAERTPKYIVPKGTCAAELVDGGPPDFLELLVAHVADDADDLGRLGAVAHLNSLAERILVGVELARHALADEGDRVRAWRRRAR